MSQAELDDLFRTLKQMNESLIRIARAIETLTTRRMHKPTKMIINNRRNVA